MSTPATGKAFAVMFQDLMRWDAGFFRQVSWNWSQDKLKPIGSVLDRVARVIPRSDFKGQHIIDKITFGGELLSAELQEARQYKGRLFSAHSGELIYSKIRLKQGSVAVVPSKTDKLAVSAEYPVYRVKQAQASADYLLLVLRSHAFQKLLTGMSHGGSTKTRINPYDFERLIIPIPEIPTQQAIVNYWNTAITAVFSAQAALSGPVKDLNDRLRRMYHAEAGRDVIHTRHFALDFKDLSAWDVKAGRAAAFRLACPSFRPLGDYIEDASETVRPFDEPDKEWPVYGVNNKDGVFLNSTQRGDAFNAPYKRIRKDWFFHNPTRCNVGSLGMVPDVPEDAITSPEYQVWRVRPDAAKAMVPGFLACLIQTPFFIELVQFNRVGAVKQRMYTENLCQLRIPYLPVAEQKAYVRDRKQAITALEVARKRLDTARREVEAMILGTMKVKP